MGEPNFSFSLLPWHNLFYWYTLNSLWKEDKLRPKWLLPQRATLWALPVHYKDLWKIRAPVEYTEGFNLQPFDDLIMVSLIFFSFVGRVKESSIKCVRKWWDRGLTSFVKVYAGQGGGGVKYSYNLVDVLFGWPLMKSDMRFGEIHQMQMANFYQFNFGGIDLVCTQFLGPF